MPFFCVSVVSDELVPDVDDVPSVELPVPLVPDEVPSLVPDEPVALLDDVDDDVESELLLDVESLDVLPLAG